MSKKFSERVTSVLCANGITVNLFESLRPTSMLFYSEIKLSNSNVLKFILEDGSWFVVRPSEIEPKIKIYMVVVGKDFSYADEKM